MRGEQGSAGRVGGRPGHRSSLHPRGGRRRGARTAALTGAHADLAVGRRAEVAEEALVRVARVALGAQLAQLLGAHAAAAAAVQYEADAGRAAGRRRGRTLARAAAVLAGGVLRGGGGGQRTLAARRPGPCPAPPARPPPRRWPPTAPRGSPLTRQQRASRSTKAQRTGPRPAADMVGAAGGTDRAEGAAVAAMGWARRWRRRVAGSGRRSVSGRSGLRSGSCRAGAAAVGGGGGGRSPGLELHWLPPLSGKSCCVGLRRAARGFYTLRAAPARQ